MKLLRATLALFFVTLSSSYDCDKDNNWHTLETPESARANCGPMFSNQCYCLRKCYEGKHRYLVNCTDTKFLDVKPLAHLPNETEVLIFTGNVVSELPWNVFGSSDNLPNLRVIDMSNNQIREIHGKAFHHVQHVERLILNFNELSLDTGRSHPRVFSNFLSLAELHLTDAFKDGPPRSLAETLHDIFVSSNLTQLRKLHLEQNEISEFQDPGVFCDLPNLLDLHLGDNSLTGLHFNLTCLGKLRFLDLERNKFTRVFDHDLRAMDELAKHDRSFAVDLSGNPFECSCKLNPFVRWLKSTKVQMQHVDNLRCREGGTVREFHESENCLKKSMASVQRGMTVALFLLSGMLIVLVGALIYVQRVKIQKQLGPILESIDKRVRYTSIASGDTREET